MPFHVLPTENIVGTFGGMPADVLREIQFTDLLRRAGQSVLRQYVSNGLNLSADAGLSVAVSDGNAIINGYQVRKSGTETVGNLANNRTLNAPNFIYLELVKDGNGLVTSAKLTPNTTGTAPADSVLIGIAATSGGVVTAVANSVGNPPGGVRTYAGDDTNDRLIFQGYKPRRVSIVSNDDTDPGEIGIQTLLTSGDLLRPLITNPSHNGVTFPVITDHGFKVSRSGASGPRTNVAGATYHYYCEV
jgi:hypothetical protein